MFSTANRKSLATALAGAAIASAMAISGASAMPESGVSGGYGERGYQDLRSPDAVDSARAAAEAPSTRPTEAQVYPGLADGAREADIAPAAPQRVVVDEPAPSGGFDGVSAAIGAAAGAGLLILLVAGGGLMRRHPATRGSALGA
jgi:hypothetical protein